jgi:pimeloyl-ACP methyl ester carboxylesterase
MDISFSSGELQLAGSLETPGDSKPGPAALLLSGSGPIDRDSNTKRLGIDVMRRMATHLATHEVVSLRYDKRGVGDSEGGYLSTGFHDNIADARAALEALRSRPEVDPDRVLVIGHSEGALIAAELASDDRLAGVVLLAGAAQSGKEVLRWQARQVAATLPKPARWITKLLRQDIVRTQAKRFDQIEETTEDVVRIQLVKLNAKWYREFMASDPSAALRRAVVPVLAITGSKDIQVDPGDVDLMHQMVPTRFTGHVIDDVTHLLRSEDGPPTVRTYKKQARRPLDQRVLDLISAWITDSIRGRNGAGNQSS